MFCRVAADAIHYMVFLNTTVYLVEAEEDAPPEEDYLVIPGEADFLRDLIDHSWVG